MSVADFRASCNRLEASTDAQLNNYFAVTEALRSLANFSNPDGIAVGLKGVGKTSAYRYLTDDVRVDGLCLGVKADSYDLQLPSTDLNFEACRKQFEHDIIMEALNLVGSREAHLGRKVKKTDVAAARGASKRYSTWLSEKLAKFGGGGISFLGFGFTLPTGKNGQRQTSVGLLRTADMSGARELLRRICAQIQLRIVIDDPELVFSTSQKLDVDLVGGLCLAAIRLSHDIPGLKVVVLLKTHVYEPVLASVEDLFNYREHRVRLGWNREELRELLRQRMKWARVRWEQVFEPETSREATSAFDALIDAARNGPRDLLRGVDLALGASNERPIAPAHLAIVRAQLARESLQELAIAHHRSYPAAAAVLKALFNGHASRRFRPDELFAHVASPQVQRALAPQIGQLSWLQRLHSGALPKWLAEIGALTFEVADGDIPPSSSDYTAELLERAESIRLVDALVPTMEAGRRGRTR